MRVSRPTPATFPWCPAGFTIPLGDAAPAAYRPYRDCPVILGIRPEDLGSDPGHGASPVDLRVVAIEALGPEVILIANLPGGLEIAARMGRDFTASIGSTACLFLDPATIHLFDPATTKAIPSGREARQP